MIANTRVGNIAEGLETLKRFIRKKEEAGESTLVFAEDRLTLLIERAICEELGGSFLTDVKTFSRYLKKTDEKILSKQGSVMKVGEIMLALKEELECFNKEHSAKTAARSIYETIAQFAACNITPEMLENIDEEDKVLSMKCNDIAKIYSSYRAFLENEGYSDENSMLSALPAAIASDRSLREMNVVFFCFGSFTRQAQEGIRAAMENAKNVYGVFTAGEEEFYTNEGERAFLAVAADHGGSKGFASNVDLYSPEKKKLAASLFNADVFRLAPVATDAIETYECTDKTQEVACAAALVKKHVLSGARFKEINLFVPDVKEYYFDLQKVFSEFKIPCFSDVKKGLDKHPLAKFLLSLFRAVDEKCSPVAVSDVVSNVFFGESGEYANYLLKFAAHRGGALKPLKSDETLLANGYDKESLTAARERFLALYRAIKPADLGENYCSAIRSVLAQVNADELLHQLEEEYDDVATKSYLSQIDDAMDALLKEIAAISGKTKFTAGEFYDVLSDGFTAAEISLIPIKSDAVFIGDLSSSKVNDGKIVIALGLTNDVPLVSSDVALISDRDILRLSKKNVDVAPLISEVNLRARESVALNLLSFTEKLYLTYPVIAGGKEKEKSEILSYVSAAFSDGKEKLRPKKSASLFPYDASEAIPAQKAVYRERDLIRSRQKTDTGEYAALAVLTEGKLPLSSFVNERESIENGYELFFGKKHDRSLSPTLVESFHSCPYRTFAERGLQLKEPQEGMMQYTDSGTFIHEVLRGVGEMIAKEEIADVPACVAAAKEVGKAVLARPEYRAMMDDEADRFVAERLIDDGVVLAKKLFEQLHGRSFRIREIEQSCYIRSLGVRGKIDRMDENEDSVRIIDYKTGNIQTSVSNYYMGEKIQLQLYASAALDRLPDKKAAGIFYFPARVKFDSVGKSADEKEDAFSLQGFIRDDNRLKEEMSEICCKTKAVPEEGFRDFLSYADKITEHTKDLLKEGFIRPSPAAEACGYCRYKGMCGYDGGERRCPVSRIGVDDVITIVNHINEEEK